MGTKIDIGSDKDTIEKLKKDNQRPISTAVGEKLRAESGAVKYVECSALTQVRFTSIFHRMVKIETI